MGDAVLAVFGAPVAHEDDPERALDAALDMLDAARALSRAVGGAARPAGDTAHRHPHRPGGGRQPRRRRRRRLCGDRRHGEHDRAPPGGGGARARSWCPRPPTRSRGIASRSSRPANWRCAARPSRSSSIACSARSPSPIGPRPGGATGSRRRWSDATDELDQLLAAFDRMQRGRAQVVSLVGEAGTGKSRLIAEFLARLDSRRPARRHGRAPGGLLVAGRADLRRLRRALPRSLSGGPGGFAGCRPAEAGGRPAGARAPGPRRRSHRAGAELRARAGGERSRATSSPSSSSARSCWPRAR